MFKLLTLVHSQLPKLRQDIIGASLAEYALLLSLITVALAVSVGVLGGAIGDVITAAAGYFGAG